MYRCTRLSDELGYNTSVFDAAWHARDTSLLHRGIYEVVLQEVFSEAVGNDLLTNLKILFILAHFVCQKYPNSTN